MEDSMTEQLSVFSDRLRTLRAEAGLSQYALAKRTGLSKETLSKLEMGHREPAWGTVQMLAAALGVECTAFADPAIRPGPLQPPHPCDFARLAKVAAASSGESTPKRTKRRKRK